MARTTGPQKLDKVLRFLIALRDAKLSGPLTGAGFTDEDMEEGWSLLRASAPHSLEESAAAAEHRVRQAMAKLEDWAKRHIRFVETAVKNRHPQAHAKLYDGLPKDGTLRVQKFLEHLEGLTDDDGVATRVLLEKRGLNAAAIAEARALLEAAHKAPSPTAHPDYTKAEEAAWRWCLEWVEIARETVEDARILRRLGFGSSEAD